MTADVESRLYRAESWLNARRTEARTRGNSWKNGGDPGGIRTRDLDLERVASWARLDDGVPCFGDATRFYHGAPGTRGRA